MATTHKTGESQGGETAREKPIDSLSVGGINGITPEIANQIKKVLCTGVEYNTMYFTLNVKGREIKPAKWDDDVEDSSREVSISFESRVGALGDRQKVMKIAYTGGIPDERARELVKGAAGLILSVKGHIGVSEDTEVSVRFSKNGSITNSRLACVQNNQPFPEVIPAKEREVVSRDEDTGEKVKGLTSEGGKLPTLRQLADIDPKNYRR